jgi:hypothetical protein
VASKINGPPEEKTARTRLRGSVQSKLSAAAAQMRRARYQDAIAFRLRPAA